jgi:hypothetical protein
MEKKGEIFNQLAIISDLLENANLELESTTIIFVIEEKEFKKIYEKIIKKTNTRLEEPDDTFSVKIGQVNFIFNKSSV